MRPIYMTLTYP